MASKREGMLQAFVAALGVAGPITGTARPTGLVVHRMRTRPISDEDLESGPVMVVWWAGDDTPRPDATVKEDRTARIWVEIRAQQSGNSPDAALDPLYVWAVKALMADITLGGATIELEEGPSVPDLEEQQVGLCAMGVQFLAKYQSSYKDPEAI